ncbi:ESPR-type extended signal peptide-containing protein [Paraburkholderia fynbosensis]|uniref:ESPR domain-containing protein n=1 Tax=Paraburkholderia fynbosensis TaxID=1200993 RepID=A0A6J5FQ58_9BURK|nr:ESPR-type extended signal peptide-containing protein [Paraburkholderia fynbosensis]CAB3784938.1 hypothetical protein LMG27177_01716 [Paraburkholderia fynbosensis]
MALRRPKTIGKRLALRGGLRSASPAQAMNNRCYRLVFSKLRGMLVAVAETAIGHGTSHGETGPSSSRRPITLFAMRHVAFAALAIFGLAPVLADAQIVPSGAHAPNVISTANGLPQVNVKKPSGAGVSLNTCSQFDVSSGGAILNNSPVNTNTQLAGPSVVKNTIENGVNYSTRPGTTGYYDPVNNVRVVTNSKTGLVVTVIPGAP